MSLEILFLGSGTSAGVPMIGCHCPVCESDDPRDQRTRASVIIRYPDPAGQPRQFLIDTTPEMRLQIIRHRIDRIDGVMITHTHADHIFGIDDLRRFNAVMNAPVDVYSEQDVLDRLRTMFSYIFEPHQNVNASFIPTLLPRTVVPGEPVELLGGIWTPIRLLHGRLPILGYRIDQGGASIAYCTDVSSVPPESFPLLENVDVLVVDALRYRHHPTHMTVDQALELIDRVEPGRAYLTHIAHDIQHADLAPRLPENVFLSYDGLAVHTGRPTGMRSRTGESARESP